MINNMENINLVKINKQRLLSLLAELSIDPVILKKQITFLCYEWQEDKLLIFTNSETRIVSRWLTIIKQMIKESTPIVGKGLSPQGMRNIFPEEIGVNIMIKNSYGKTPYNYEELKDVKSLSQIFMLGVASENRTLGELYDLSTPFLNVLPPDINTNFVVTIDKEIRNEGNYICFMMKT